MSAVTPFSWSSDGRTDVGKVRTVNEDSMLERPDIGLWAIADGMGGHTAGDMASSTTVSSLQELRTPRELSEFVDEVENRLVQTNTLLREIAAEKKGQTVGCTVVALLIFRGYAVCIWAGDSRVYRYRADTIERLTQDHALVEDL
ncbi:MAG: serine/threonine-protein phosphatase, partial [Proteobacteria bacterium]|nr:serine/threonine-protein phosphatase [Pseudomonadota bacterium]